MKDTDKPHIGDWGEGFVVKGLPKTQSLPITGTLDSLEGIEDLRESFLAGLGECTVDLEIKIQEPCPTLYDLYKDMKTIIIDFGNWYSPRLEANVLDVVAQEDGGVYLELSKMKQINPHADRFYGKFLNWIASVYYRIRWVFVRHLYKEGEEYE